MTTDVFDGETIDATRDSARLGHQLALVRRVLADGRWITLDRLSLVTGAPAASVSARIRDLRKARFGAHTIERRRVAHTRGLWEYRMVTP